MIKSSFVVARRTLLKGLIVAAGGAVLPSSGAGFAATAPDAPQPEVNITMQTIQQDEGEILAIKIQIQAIATIPGGDKLTRVAFTNVKNGIVEVAGTPLPIPMTVPLVPNASTWFFTLRKLRRGEPFDVAFVATDLVGDVAKFAGAGMGQVATVEPTSPPTQTPIASKPTQTLTMPTPTAVPVTPDPVGRWFNVKTLGARADGRTDDSNAILAAIAAAKEDGGGVVYFPTGSYVCNATINIDSNSITLLGDGEDATRIGVSNIDRGRDLLVITGNTTKRVERTVIRDLTLSADSRFANTFPSEVSCRQNIVRLGNTWRVTLERVRIDHAELSGITFDDVGGGPDQTLILNCDVTSNHGNGVEARDVGHSTHILGGTFEFNAIGINAGGANSLFIEHADIEWNRLQGIKIYQGINFAIRDCTFENNARSLPETHDEKVHIWIGSTNHVSGLALDGNFLMASHMKHLVRLDSVSNSQLMKTNSVYDAAGFPMPQESCFVYFGRPGLASNITFEGFACDRSPNLARLVNDSSAVVMASLDIGDRVVKSGAVAPEGTVVATAGSLYIQMNDGSVSYFVKQSGTSLTGWRPLML